MKLSIAILTLLLVPSTTLGSVHITAIETVGGDVVFGGSGTLDLTALTAFGTGSGASGVIPSASTFLIGLGGIPLDVYSGVSASPATFGPGGVRIADSGAGSLFGISSNNLLAVTENYSSGDSLIGSMTFTGETFASLGVTEGTYVWSWGSGANADSITLQLGRVVPEPASVAVWSLLGVVGIGIVRRRRQRV